MLIFSSIPFSLCSLLASYVTHFPSEDRFFSSYFASAYTFSGEFVLVYVHGKKSYCPILVSNIFDNDESTCKPYHENQICHCLLKVSLRSLFYFYFVQLAIGGGGHVTQHMRGSTVHNQNKNNFLESETDTKV